MIDAKPAMNPISIRAALTEAIGWWERRRIVYNAVLIVLVAAVFVASWPTSALALRLDTLLQLFVLAVLANVAYCAAYVVDIAVQFSDFRARWLRWRWLLFALGLALAAVSAQFIARALFDAAA